MGKTLAMEKARDIFLRKNPKATIVTVKAGETIVEKHVEELGPKLIGGQEAPLDRLMESRPTTPGNIRVVTKQMERKVKTAKLDAKFSGVIFKVKDGSIVPDDEYMVFLAKDQAFLPTLKFYREQCVKLRADEEHIEAVDRTIDRLITWRENNQHRLKVPDAKGEKLVG